jgi:hypothetical protein
VAYLCTFLYCHCQAIVFLPCSTAPLSKDIDRMIVIWIGLIASVLRSQPQVTPGMRPTGRVRRCPEIPFANIPPGWDCHIKEMIGTLLYPGWGDSSQARIQERGDKTQSSPRGFDSLICLSMTLKARWSVSLKWFGFTFPASQCRCLG